MKEFEIPKMEIVKFNAADIITTSGDMFPIAPISGLSEDESDIISMG